MYFVDSLAPGFSLDSFCVSFCSSSIWSYKGAVCQKGLFSFTPYLVLYSLTTFSFESASAAHCLLGLIVSPTTPAALPGESGEQPPIFPTVGTDWLHGPSERITPTSWFLCTTRTTEEIKGFHGVCQSIPAVVLQADKNSEETSFSNSGTALMQGLMQRSSDLNSSGSNAISLTQLMVPAEDLIVPKCLPSLPEEVVTYNRNGRAQHVTMCLAPISNLPSLEVQAVID